jgi:hypothetical protein
LPDFSNYRHQRYRCATGYLWYQRLHDPLFIFFNCFAINMVLQYKQLGRWRDYLFGEKAYIILSLTAKSLLAWQVFANVLILK